MKSLLDGFKLSEEQVKYLRKQYREINEQLADNQLQGMFRLVARQEAMSLLYDLHKLEEARLESLGDNQALVRFVEGS